MPVSEASRVQVYAPRTMSVVKSKSSRRKVIQVGDVAPDFELVDCNGKRHSLSDFQGRRVLLSFFRIASCPICLYNVDRLKQQTEFLNQAGIRTISIFPSTPKQITKYAMENLSNESLALSDKEGLVYNSFQVKNLPAKDKVASIIEGTKKKYRKYYSVSGMRREVTASGFDRRSKLLPADFLIDEDGTVVDLFRAKNMQDHMTIERIESFIPEDWRCKCNCKGCLFPSCRKRYEEIRKESEAMLFMG